MRPHLIDGRLILPSSPVAVQARHQQIAYEVGNLAGRITMLEGNGAKDEAYRARKKRDLLAEEERQLRAWLDEHNVPTLPPRVRKAAVEDWNEFWRE